MAVSKDYVAWLEHRVANAGYENDKLQSRIRDLEDTRVRRNDWMDQAKQEAGFHLNDSFDTVWNTILRGYELSQTNKLWQANLIKDDIK